MTETLGEKRDVIIKGVKGKMGVDSVPVYLDNERETDNDNDKYHKSRSIYDDIFKTLATRKSRWLIPLVNELFPSHIPENSDVKLMNETHYIKRETNGAGNNDYRIMTDCIFSINEEKYHLELQSTYDGRMVIRVVEYDFITALERLQYGGEPEIELELPNSAVIFIKEDKRIPKEYVIKFKSGDNYMYHKVKVMEFSRYSIEEIISKKLFILLPFYITRYEDALGRNDVDLAEQSIKVIKEMLQACCEDGTIWGNDVGALEGMVERVIKHLTHVGEKQERLLKAMKGEMIELEIFKLEDAVEEKNKELEEKDILISEQGAKISEQEKEIQELRKKLADAKKGI